MKKPFYNVMKKPVEDFMKEKMKTIDIKDIRIVPNQDLEETMPDYYESFKERYQDTIVALIAEQIKDHAQVDAKFTDIGYMEVLEMFAEKLEANPITLTEEQEKLIK